MTKQPRLAGLIYGSVEHYLDHLAPLCSLLEVPLILTDGELVEMAKKYYPNLEILYWEPILITEKLVSTFDLILSCTPRDLFDEVFFFAQKMLQKRVITLWCPHGNSDKGHSSFYMEALRKEEASLLYGEQMVQFLKEKGSFDQLKAHLITGNFRYTYFKTHKPFYEELIASRIGQKLRSAKRTLLYAPTWQDHEFSSSFFDALDPLVTTLPEEHNLLVKLHPNLRRQEEWKVEMLQEKYEMHERVVFIENYPPVYSLLSIVDAYIGDMSSIGYDFLNFDKPLFFLNQKGNEPHKEPYLFRSGVEISKDHYWQVNKIISDFFAFELRDFSSIRKEISHFAFGKEKTAKELQKEVFSLCEQLLQEALPFF